MVEGAGFKVYSDALKMLEASEEAKGRDEDSGSRLSDLRGSIAIQPKTRIAIPKEPKCVSTIYPSES